MNTKDSEDHNDQGRGPKYEVNIEGTTHEWERDTITVAEIRLLGNLPADIPVIEIDKDNNQRTLTEDEVVQVKPGHGFSKKVKYQRG